MTEHHIDGRGRLSRFPHYAAERDHFIAAGNELLG
jgi:hypothetical protein